MMFNRPTDSKLTDNERPKFSTMCTTAYHCFSTGHKMNLHVRPHETINTKNVASLTPLEFINVSGYYPQ